MCLTQFQALVTGAMKPRAVERCAPDNTRVSGRTETLKVQSPVQHSFYCLTALLFLGSCFTQKVNWNQIVPRKAIEIILLICQQGVKFMWKSFVSNFESNYHSFNMTFIWEISWITSAKATVFIKHIGCSMKARTVYPLLTHHFPLSTVPTALRVSTRICRMCRA